MLACVQIALLHGHGDVVPHLGALVLVLVQENVAGQERGRCRSRGKRKEFFPSGRQMGSKRMMVRKESIPFPGRKPREMLARHGTGNKKKNWPQMQADEAYAGQNWKLREDLIVFFFVSVAPCLSAHALVSSWIDQ